jgi:transposase
MSYKEHSVTEIFDILRRIRAGDGKRQIAKATSIDRNTIRKYLRVAEECGFTVLSTHDELHEIALSVFRRAGDNNRPNVGDDIFAPHKETINTWLQQDGLTLTKAHIKLTRMGVAVTYSTLYRFAVKHLSFGSKQSTVRMVESAPGEVAEVDFGRLGLEYDLSLGRKRVLYALVVTLIMSRHQYVFTTHRQTVDALIEGIEAAWDSFGGVTRRVVLDNMKAAVVKADRYEPIFNQIFLEYSELRGLIIDPAPVRHPEAKATVERQVSYIHENFFKGEEFMNRDHAQKEADKWCRDVAGLRIHGTTRKRPLQTFLAEEKQHLKPLSGDRFDVPVRAEAKVHPDHHIRFGHTLYSVPYPYLRKTVSVRGDSRLVRFYYDNQLIKTHTKMAKGKRSTDYNDYPPEKRAYAMRDCEYYIRKGGEYGPAQGQLMEALCAGDFPWARLREAQKLLRLSERYGAARVEAAARRALSFGLINVHRVEGMIIRAGDSSSRLAATPTPLPARFERNASYFATQPKTIRRTIVNTTSEVKQLLKQLRLSGLLSTLPDRVSYAAANKLGYQEFLELVLSDELGRRRQGTLERRLQNARVNPDQVMERFDWDADITVDRDRLKGLMSLEFIDRKENVILTGPVGVGKTYIANALAHAACRREKNVIVKKAAKMFKDLSTPPELITLWTANS